MKKITLLLLFLLAGIGLFAVDLNVAGSMNNWNEKDPNYKMTEIGATGVYTLEKVLDAGTYEFRVVYYGTSIGPKNGDNRKFVLSEQKTVKFYAKVISETHILFFADAQELYVIGKAVGGWNAVNMKLMTNTATEATYTADVVAGDYKIVSKDKEGTILWDDITPVDQTVGGTGNYTIKLDFETFAASATVNTDYFRSATSGNWSAVASWEYSDDDADWVPATTVPDVAADVITILNGHTITVDANTTVSSVNINTGATLTVGTGIMLQTNGGVNATGTFNVNGTFQLNAGGSVTTTSPTYGENGTLVYNTGGTYGRSAEFNNPANLILKNNTILNYPNGNNAFNATLSGNLTIDAGSALYMDFGDGAATGKLEVGGNVVLNGNLSLGDGTGGDIFVGGNLTVGSTAVFYDKGRAVFFNGSAEQTITLGKDLTITYLIIEPGANLTLASGYTLTATNFTINSNSGDGTGTFINNGTLASTTAKVNQYLSEGRNWWYLSSPVTNASSSVFAADQIGKHVENYLDDEDALTTAPYYTAPFSTPEDLNPGRGYVISRNSTTGATYTFTGSGLNNGDVAITPTRTGTTEGARGFNLIGNPYPSYIDWDDLYVDEATDNIRNAIWFRTLDGGVMKFHTYSDGDAVPASSVSVSIASGKIAPMQAFWVKVDADPISTATVSNGALTFKNIHREHFVTGNNPLKVKAVDNRQRLRLIVSNGEVQDEMLLVGKSYASNGLDSYDIDKRSNSNTAIPEIYSLLQNEKLVINSMNELKAGVNVLLGIRPGIAGNFTLEVSQFENINDKVILKDELNDTETELTAGASYEFTADANITNDRFSIEFRAPGMTTSVDNPEMQAVVFVNADNRIVIQAAGLTTNDRIVVHNLAGQQLISQSANGQLTVIDRALNAGVYVVKVNSCVQKVVVN